MSDISNLASQLQNYLTVCLARSFDIAMTYNTISYSNLVGTNWFNNFKQKEALLSRPVLSKEHISIYHCDFQALLKTLCFRKEIRYDIISYFYPTADMETEFGDRSAFYELIYRLIKRYRNGIFAHTSASDIENYFNGSDKNSIYGYTEAINDMLKLGYIFGNTVDDNGVSYYTQMQYLYETFIRESNYQYYPVDDTIACEMLQISRGQFCDICHDISIEITTTNGQLYFMSNNYADTIDRIKDKLHIISLNKENENYSSKVSEMTKTKSKSKLIAITCSILGLFLVTGIIIFMNNSKKKVGSDSPTTEANPTETTTSSDHEITTETVSSSPTTDNIGPTTSEKEIRQIAKELVTNAVKYAQSDDKDGFNTIVYGGNASNINDFINEYVQFDYPDFTYYYILGDGTHAYIGFINYLCTGTYPDTHSMYHNVTQAIIFKDGKWYLDASDETNTALQSDNTSIYPNEMLNAINNGNNYVDLSNNNFSWLKDDIVINGCVDVNVFLMWQNEDGSISYLVNEKNGTNEIRSIKSVTVTATDSNLGELFVSTSEGHSLAPGQSDSFIVTLPADQVKTGNQKWSDISVNTNTTNH